VTTKGLLVGALLALIAWFGPQAITARALRSMRRTHPTDALAAARSVGFQSVAVAWLAGIVSIMISLIFPGTFGQGETGEIGAMLIAVPAAIASIIVYGTSPIAIRRFMAQLEA